MTRLKKPTLHSKRIVTNVAFATGTDPGGEPVDSPSDTETVTAVQNPLINLSKTLAGNAD